MKGSVRKRGKKWSYRIDLGKNGDQRSQIEKGGYATKREADKALADALYQINNTDDYVENQKITFSQVFTEFIENEAPATRAYATIKRYNSLYRNHYAERFGSYYMYQISRTMIEDFLNEKRVYLSEEYVKGLYKTLKVIFGYAYKRKYMKKDIFCEVTPPPDPRHIGEIKTYTQEERDAMEKRLHGTNLIVSYYIALNTGLRESEVFALQWSDVDFEKKKIKVCKQLLFQDHKWCFCPLKTINAYRSVNITDSFCTFLSSLKEQHEQNRLLYGDGYKRNFVTDRLIKNKETLLEIPDFINIKRNGDMLSTNSIKFMSRVFKKDLNISEKSSRNTGLPTVWSHCMKKRYIIIIPVLCLVLMTIIFRMIFFIDYVPSSSMEPTLKAGSVILGLRWHGELKNGDIIIFRRGDSLLVKRIAASQGDTISISGHMHTVPGNCYYVLGDNTSNSYDSRYWKDPYISDADVVAKLIGL